MTTEARAITWIVLLRAVNVGRANRVGMADLRACLESMGYGAVRTYVQSGNAVFTAPQLPPGAIAAAVHDRLAADFAIDVGAIVLSANELSAIACDNPLLAEPGADESQLHVVVLESEADPARFGALALPALAGERAVLLGRAVYLVLPHGMGRTKLTNAYFERALGQTGTARNWRTMTALLHMAADKTT